jgi:hypothetical protein
MDPTRITICIDVSTEESYNKTEELLGYFLNNLQFTVAEYDPHWNVDVCIDKIKTDEEIKS